MEAAAKISARMETAAIFIRLIWLESRNNSFFFMLSSLSENVFGEVIPGLWAAGEMTGGVHGAGYMSGSAFGKAMTFGRIAAKDIAKQK